MFVLGEFDVAGEAPTLSAEIAGTSPGDSIIVDAARPARGDDSIEPSDTPTQEEVPGKRGGAPAANAACIGPSSVDIVVASIGRTPLLNMNRDWPQPVELPVRKVQIVYHQVPSRLTAVPEWELLK